MTVGILGGGQLGKLLAEACIKLDHQCLVYDPNENCEASEVAKVWAYGYGDSLKLKSFAQNCDCITYDFKNMPIESIKYLSKYTDIKPGILPLKISQDRLKEKRYLNSIGIPTAQFLEVNTLSDLEFAAEKLSYPFILKNRSNGKGSKSPITVRKKSELKDSFQYFVYKELIAEEFIKFKREFSIIGTRSIKGNMVFYDLCETQNSKGEFKYTLNKPGDEYFERGMFISKLLMESLAYAGTVTLKFFQTHNSLVVNEYLPRVHHSGLWTINGTSCSQFENHIRAITGSDIITPLTMAVYKHSTENAAITGFNFM